MPAPILYCGDTNLDSAASYLAGLMTHFGWDFDYVPSHVPLSVEQLGTRKLVIFSDYSTTQVADDVQNAVVNQVVKGAGFLMIGGWESFHGESGNWDGTQVGEMLPVEIRTKDDRRNFCHGAILAPPADREGLWNLPWDKPPVIGGLNDVYFKEGVNCDCLLEAFPMTPYRGQFENGRYGFEWEDCMGSHPVLVTCDCVKGRVAAFMSDVAPHWVGGFVDWGSERVMAQAPGAAAIEVGSDYAQFWKRLLSWTGRFE